MKTIIFIFFLLLFYTPLYMIIFYSFNNSNLDIAWKGFTFKWYKNFFYNFEILSSFYHSCIIACISSIVSCIISFIYIFNIIFYCNNISYIIRNILFFISLTPDIIISITYLSLLNYYDIHINFFLLIVCNILYIFPFISLILYKKIINIRKKYIDSLICLDISYLKILYFIICPLIYKDVIFCILLGFSLSFDNVAINYFLSIPEYPTFPTILYSLLKTGLIPEIYIIFSIIYIVNILALLFTIIYKIIKK